MSLDMEIIICCFCKRPVSMSDIVVNNGMTYHDHCIKLELSRELAGLDKKYELGKISLVEANYKKDLQFTYDIIKNEDSKQPAKKDPFRFCSKPSGTFVNPARRQKSLKSVQKEQFLLNEQRRAERWAWESFNIIDTQLLLPEGERKPDDKLFLYK